MEATVKKPARLIARFEIPLFILLTYFISWWTAPFSGGQILPYGPTIAAVLVAALSAGRQGLGGFWRSIRRWPISWRWLVIGPLIIVLYQSVAVGMNLLLGANMTAAPGLSLAAFLELLLLGGLWEEPGWTGYALPKLQERFAGHRNKTALVILVLGTLRGIWHIPLFLYGHIPWYDVVILSFTMQALITWLYNRSGGSTLTAMTFHFMSNIAGLALLFTFTNVERTTYQLLYIGLASVIAFALHFFTAGSVRARQGSTA
jgi:hypothetical protein